MKRSTILEWDAVGAWLNVRTRFTDTRIGIIHNSTTSNIFPKLILRGSWSGNTVSQARVSIFSILADHFSNKWGSVRASTLIQIESTMQSNEWDVLQTRSLSLRSGSFINNTVGLLEFPSSGRYDSSFRISQSVNFSGNAIGRFRSTGGKLGCPLSRGSAPTNNRCNAGNALDTDKFWRRRDCNALIGSFNNTCIYEMLSG